MVPPHLADNPDMIDLTRLNVSLTKHGAYKVLHLLTRYSPDQVLEYTNHDELDIHIDVAQTKKNMSIGTDGVVPEYWAIAKKAGEMTLRALVFASIVHSHHKLISTMVKSKPRVGTGMIVRGNTIQEKEYTNFADIVDNLGYTVGHQMNFIEYDISEILSLQEFPGLFARMLNRKLVVAGKPEGQDVIETAISLGLNQVFGLKPSEYLTWLRQNAISIDASDVEPADRVAEIKRGDRLIFRSGHLIRDTRTVTVSSRSKRYTVKQTHNFIQNQLFEKLSTKYGRECVGTEQAIGDSNRVDLVVKTKKRTEFYEIKTSSSARQAIREAIPQLIEYAYFPNDSRADYLFVVSLSPLDEDSSVYMSVLRDRINLPIWYICFDQVLGTFSEPM